MVSNQVSHAFAKKLEASGVTVAEWVVLRNMYGGDQTTSPSVVADYTGLSRGAISKLISRLLKKDLVTRTEAAGDRRYQDIQLTAAALKLVPKLAQLADANDDAFFAVLNPGERRTLKELLQRIADDHAFKTVPID